MLPGYAYEVRLLRGALMQDFLFACRLPYGPLIIETVIHQEAPGCVALAITISSFIKQKSNVG